MNQEQLKKLPKAELHCHLDGSLSPDFIRERLGREVAAEELMVSPDCRNLAEYLEKFDIPLSCMQDEAGLKGAGYDFIRTVSRENMRYVEVRFAPLFSVHDGLNTEKVLTAVLEGLEQGKQEFGTRYQVIVCAMRNHSFEENLGMLKTARAFLGQGVCAADLAGDEASWPMSGFTGLFEEVRKMGFPYTIHAGECGSVQNIIDAVNCGAARIGHGTAMRGNPEVQKLCREKHIGIEMCPISNLQTRAVESTAQYPMREFLDAGLLATINTDNRTVSGSSVTKELEFIQKEYGVRDEEVLLLMRNAVSVSFAPDEVKAELLKEMK